jgi:hypothetical protein
VKQGDDRQWVMADRKAAATLVRDAPEVKGRVLLWDQIPESVQPSSIRALRLVQPADPKRVFPTSIRRLSHLDSLVLGPTIDAAMVQGIGKDALPERLKSLKIFTGGKKVVWPSHVLLPQVNELRADCVVRFTPTNSIVRNDHCRYGPQMTVLAQLTSYVTLKELELFPIHSPEVFKTVAHLQLRAFGVLSGKIQTLEGIETLKGLHARLNSLRQLKRIGSIAGLQHLQKLEIMLSPH